ncbi:glycosyltransferase family 2 protein [Gillisia limnaea]|uniref:Glycosyl transferase family 2 n=1 Tax=Gillisia limnaea (strain DSM 15749 / LMG 21470 / R-8282) TaxID=865937 RepID=H2BV73_GILLR|nr:glycosyltransferase [Gillisia limnaea]EHQ01738.1 glycosyl transferase family 2 [Gillisia limnaea DSM 15749]
MLSIIYPYRNRNVARVKASLVSLQEQTQQNFEVVFVDYGSEESYAQEVKIMVSGFGFATYYYVGNPGLLWNKSKALNYGILKVTTAYVFFTDVDVVFHPSLTAVMQQLATPVGFYLFTIGYLPKEINTKEAGQFSFEQRKPTHTGDTFGIGLFPLEALQKVEGLDTFFHFYGSEDADLNARLQQAGYALKYHKPLLIKHLWHPRYPVKKDNQLTVLPRLTNVQRINQRHFLRNREKGVIKPSRQDTMGKVISKEESDLLQKPTKIVKVNNILSHVEHFLGEELPSYTGEIIKVEFVEDPYFHTLKHKLKKLLGKQTQPYCSLKEVNDRMLKEIVFNYRDANYSFEISENLKSIIFCIRME